MDLFASELNRQHGQPMYRQIYEKIAERIICGKLCFGEKLPSKKRLAQQLGVSVITIQTAYDMLSDEGYIQSRPRSGFYVCRVDPLLTSGRSPQKHRHQQEPAFRFDLRMNAVDASIFPFKQWAGFMREAILDGQDFLVAGDARGDLELRESICRYLNTVRGVQCNERQVLVGAGIESLLVMLCQIFDAARFAVEEPCYPKVRTVLQNCSKDFSSIALDEEGICIADLERSGAEIVYVTPSHQFPTGITMPIGRRMDLLNWAYRGSEQGKKRYIIEDDFGGEFDLDGRPVRCLQGLDQNASVIYIGSFSRVLAPSVRVSYMVLPFDLLQITERKFRSYSSTVSRFEQQALSRFLDSDCFLRHVRKTRHALRHKRDVLLELLERIPVQSRPVCRRESVSSHAVLRLQKKNAEAFCCQAAERGVRVIRMSDFYANPQNADGSEILLGIAAPSEQDIRLAFDQLFPLF